MDSSGRISPARCFVLFLVAAAGITLTATSVVHPATTHPTAVTKINESDGAQSSQQLTAAQNPPALPARGAGAAATTEADPKAAGAPGAASLTSGPGAIPAQMLAAYRRAAATLAVEDPSCHLGWPVLAGIGKVETDHGRSWGSKARITATGEVVPTILGPVLNGHNGTALVLDTDGGAYDQNRTYDRAVGPMQFVPATWVTLGRDGNGDGVKDPNNIWDATLAAAGYLCGGDRNLSQAADLRAAIYAYNPSTTYVRAVLAWAGAYAKAGAHLPALDGVPDPLVLGAGGTAGEDPFGDALNLNDYLGSFDTSGLAALNALDGGNQTSLPLPGLHPTPTPRPAASPSHSPSPSPAPSKSPSKSPSPSPSPSTSPTPTPTPTKSPKPTPSPTPSPTPTPTPPVCQVPGVSVAPASGVTAVAVDTGKDGVKDVLRVTVHVTATKAGTFTFGVRLLDSQGQRITSVVEGVSLTAGGQDVIADLPGQDIGDAGASGVQSVRVTIRDAGDAAKCAKVLFTSAGVGTVDASTFDGWFTTIQRLNQRLAQDIANGSVTGAAATKLPKDMQTPSASAPDLAVFRTDVAGTAFVSEGEKVRLDSLAARLIAQAGAAGTETTLPLNDNTWADGVG